MLENNHIASLRGPRRLGDALFLDEHTLRANCGRCGREVIVRLDDIRDQRTIDCQECLKSDHDGAR